MTPFFPTPTADDYSSVPFRYGFPPHRSISTLNHGRALFWMCNAAWHLKVSEESVRRYKQAQPLLLAVFLTNQQISQILHPAKVHLLRVSRNMYHV